MAKTKPHARKRQIEKLQNKSSVKATNKSERQLKRKLSRLQKQEKKIAEKAKNTVQSQMIRDAFGKLRIPKIKISRSKDIKELRKNISVYESLLSEVSFNVDQTKSMLTSKSRQTLESNPLIGKLTDKEYIDLIDIVNTDVYSRFKDKYSVQSDLVVELMQAGYSTQQIENVLDEVLRKSDITQSKERIKLAVERMLGFE